MSINAIEKHAQALNKALRTDGKQYGKAWRLRIRALLQQTFAAMNARPLDGELCKSLDEQISAELEAIENHTVVTDDADVSMGGLKPVKKTVEREPMPEVSDDVSTRPVQGVEALSPVGATVNDGIAESEASCASDMAGETPARMAAGHSDGEGESRMATGHSDVGDPSPTPDAEPLETGDHCDDVPTTCEADGIGLFDLIHVQIRCFFTIRACVRPPYIGRFVTFSERYADDVRARIDKFLGVLSKGEDDFAAKTDVEVGYRDDLLPDMPERGLILYPKKKKKR